MTPDHEAQRTSPEAGERERPSRVYHQGTGLEYEVLAWVCEGFALVEGHYGPDLWTGEHSSLHAIADKEGARRAADLLRTEPGGCPTCAALAEAEPLGPIPDELRDQLPDGARIVHQRYLDDLSRQVMDLYEERGKLKRRIEEMERADG